MARPKTKPLVSTYITIKRNKKSSKYEARVLDNQNKIEASCIKDIAALAVLCARKKALS